MNNGTTEPDTQEEADNSRAMDGELKAMGRINRIMADLDADARRRVASWIHDRWELSPANKFFGDLKSDVVNKLRKLESR